MPLTKQEKQAKWPHAMEKMPSGRVIVFRRRPFFNARGRTIGFDEVATWQLTQHFDSPAAAIYAIAKTQE